MDMKELIDKVNNVKMVALLLLGIGYDGDEYVVYSIKRSNDEANIFISKLVSTSDGYSIHNDFSNGEKEVMERIVQRIISKEPIALLERDGFYFIKDVKLVGKNYFDVQGCYVTTVSISLVKECMKYYGLEREDVFESPVVNVKEDKRKLSDGFVGNLFLIVFGIFIIVFCVGVVFSVFFK